MKMRSLVFLGVVGLMLAACDSPPGIVVAEPPKVVVPDEEPDIEEEELIWAAKFPPTGNFVERPAAQSADFRRVPRAAATDEAGTGTPESDRLQLRKTAVVYEEGKSLYVPGVSASTEEFPVHTITIRMGAGGGTEFIQGDDDTPGELTPAADLTAATGAEYHRDTDGVLDYSIQATADGLVYKMRGNAIYFDFQRRFDIGADFFDWYSVGPNGVRGEVLDVGGYRVETGCYENLADATPDCTNWNFDDVEVTFGLPIAAPNTEAAWYWNVRVPLPPGADSRERNLAAQFDYTWNPNRDLGSYEMWLTNLARIDLQLEYSQGPPYRRDDISRYLNYAAYGLFVFTDNLSSFQKVARAQALHFGYDAFADETGSRTTDIPSAVTATFTGRTMAQRYLHLAGGPGRRGDREELRADITLDVRIGGDDGGGITGTISNFQMLGHDGNWHRHSGIVDPDKTERLVLAGTKYKDERTAQEDPEADPDDRPVLGAFTSDDDNYRNFPAEISSTGTYKGGVFLQSKGTDGYWRDKSDLFDTYVETTTSQFGGTFYGPTDNDLKDLETAGHWFLRGDSECEFAGTSCNPSLYLSGGVYGSFGALNSIKEFPE